mgnify:CR=1 FL=1
MSRLQKRQILAARASSGIFSVKPQVFMLHRSCGFGHSHAAQQNP